MENTEIEVSKVGLVPEASLEAVIPAICNHRNAAGETAAADASRPLSIARLFFVSGGASKRWQGVKNAVPIWSGILSRLAERQPLSCHGMPLGGRCVQLRAK